VRLLVVDDDRKLAEFLARVLTEDGHQVTIALQGEEAIRTVAEAPFDLVVLDWMLPDREGIEVCQELRRAGSVVPILMLTAKGELADRVLGLESGADDYLVKPFELDELLARTRALLRRAARFSPLRVGDLEIDAIHRAVRVRGQKIEVTTREFTLLQYLAERAGEVVSRMQLLADVWGTKFDPGSNLVEVQVSRLRDKLGEAKPMIETVRGVGYRLVTIK
jgi:DNA-binding response OmpR family regulator